MNVLIMEIFTLAASSLAKTLDSMAFSLSQKKLATLRARHGWTNKELAEHYGVSLSAIKVYLYSIDRSVKGKERARQDKCPE